MFWKGDKREEEPDLMEDRDQNYFQYSDVRSASRLMEAGNADLHNLHNFVSFRGPLLFRNIYNDLWLSHLDHCHCFVYLYGEKNKRNFQKQGFIQPTRS